MATGEGDIGRATAIAFAREGCRVAVVGRRSEPLRELADESAGMQCPSLQADVADPFGLQGVVGAVVQRCPRIDVLVRNAGLDVAARDMGSVSAAKRVAVPDVNVTGTFLMTQSVLPSMREQGSDTDVNISSLAGYRPMALTGPAYSAAKAGVKSFTESLNLAEGRHLIRARAVGPGEVATPILDKRLKRPSVAGARVDSPAGGPRADAAVPRDPAAASHRGKASHEPVDVAVRETNDGFAEVTATDHGSGVPVKSREGLVEPFQRLGHHLTRRTRGTGPACTPPSAWSRPWRATSGSTVRLAGLP